MFLRAIQRPLLLLLVYLWSTEANSSAFICSGEWPVVKNDTAASLKLLHCWLRNWQRDCTKGVYHGLGQGGGIGATIESAVRWLCFAIENGHYYRPEFTPWFVQVNNCSLSVNSVDCYFQPISTCGFQTSSITPCSSGEALSALLPKSGIDTCHLAKALKKPLQWLHGALYDFFLQYDAPGGIEARVRSRVEQILEQRKDGEALLSIHVRGGKPDSRRIPAHISHYIEAADLVAAQLLAATNKTVKYVFLSSDSQDSAIGTVESLAKSFPRQWQYLLSPHFNFAPAIENLKLVEVQHIMESASLKKMGLQPNPRELSIEYFADTEIHAGSDAFIGSSSNMYTLATGLAWLAAMTTFATILAFCTFRVISVVDRSPGIKGGRLPALKEGRRGFLQYFQREEAGEREEGHLL